MPIIEWDDRIKVGVKTIDDQHRELIELGNKLIIAVRDGKGEEELVEVLTQLREYTVFHFNYEEQLLEKIRYPKRGEQSARHAQLKRQVKDFRRCLYKREKLKPEQVKDFLIEWIVDHILEMDMEYAEYMKKNKLSDN